MTSTDGGAIELRVFTAKSCDVWALVGFGANDVKNPQVNYQEIDVDENTAEAETYKIVSLPTVIIIQNGEEARRLVGAFDKKDIQLMLQNLEKDAS